MRSRRTWGSSPRLVAVMTWRVAGNQGSAPRRPGSPPARTQLVHTTKEPEGPPARRDRSHSHRQPLGLWCPKQPPRPPHTTRTARRRLTFRRSGRLADRGLPCGGSSFGGLPRRFHPCGLPRPGPPRSPCGSRGARSVSNLAALHVPSASDRPCGSSSAFVRLPSFGASTAWSEANSTGGVTTRSTSRLCRSDGKCAGSGVGTKCDKRMNGVTSITSAQVRMRMRGCERVPRALLRTRPAGRSRWRPT